MERIARHLYKRADLFYGVLTDWKKKRRYFPLGSDLKIAKQELAVLEARNIRREDFDAGKIQGLTFSKWTDRYLDLVKHKKSLERDQRSCARLSRFFGFGSLVAITRAKVMEYKNERLAEGVKISTINRELACLKYMLRLAADEGLIDNVPPIKLDSEKHLARERIISQPEFVRLLSNSPLYLQRVLIGLQETAMRREELLGLTWGKVDLTGGLIRLAATDTKEKDKRVIPISRDLRKIFDDIHQEQLTVGNLAGRVFTREGHSIKSLKTVWEKARSDAGLPDVRLHDFRHTAITGWIVAGVSQEAVMKASGHRSLAMHYRYVNLNEQHIKEAFGTYGN